jgi:acyl carrier protein
LIYAHLGAGEGLAALELPGEFQADLNELGLHPALLDVATGSIQRLGLGNYLPLAYDQLRIYQRLPHKLYSYVKYQDLTHSSKETLTCDILITDERGVCLVAITGFSMKRVSAEIARQIAAQAVAAPAPHASGNGRRAPGPTEIGILPDEGVSAFARLLSGRRPPQLVVSVQDLPTVIAQAQSFTAEHIAEQLAARPPQPLHARPLSQGSYKAPDNDLERRIAAIWQSVLGLEHIGIDDNFFELGGTSLSGIQIVTELKKAFAVELSPVSIFEAPTIRALAAHLSPERNNQTAFQHSLDRAERKLARKRRK